MLNNRSTEKLDLPSISQVPTRGQSDVPYYNAPRPAYMTERLPSLPPVSSHHAYTSSTGSPPGSSLGSSNSSHAGSQSSYTSAAPSLGAKTPPTPQHSDYPAIPGPVTTAPGYEPYQAMNQAPQDPSSMYYPPQPHMSGSAPPPVTSSMAHYPPPQPLLQSGHAQYPPSPHYQYSGYGNGLTSPPTAPVSGMPGNVLPVPGMQPQYTGYDTTGQMAPPGMKPRVTATLWEDEGSLCFQVEARGICVARREGMLPRWAAITRVIEKLTRSQITR